MSTKTEMIDKLFELRNQRRAFEEEIRVLSEQSTVALDKTTALVEELTNLLKAEGISGPLLYKDHIVTLDWGSFAAVPITQVD